MITQVTATTGKLALIKALAQSSGGASPGLSIQVAQSIILAKSQVCGVVVASGRRAKPSKRNAASPLRESRRNCMFSPCISQANLAILYTRGDEY